MTTSLIQTIRTIFDALEHDYAGMPECDDGCRGRWEDVFGQLAVAGALDDALAWSLLRQRLASLGDGNLSLLPGPGADFVPETCGFTVRRIGEELWVTDAGLDGRLACGDAVVALDGMMPSELLTLAVGNPCGSDDEGRQDWSYLLGCAHEMTVRHTDRTVETLPVRRFPVWECEPRTCGFERMANGDACVLTVAELDDLEAAALVVEHADEVRAARLLAIDLRGCTGGMEPMAYPLLNLLFDEPTNLRSLVGPEEVLTLYTDANCDRREEQIAQLRLLAAAEDEQGRDEALAWMDENLAVIAASRGRGCIAETAEPDDLAIAAGPAGQRVAVLIDEGTADAAEWLARIAAQSPRATLVGRATKGSLDYSNPVSITFDDRFVFVYPMSKTRAAAESHGMRGVGVLPAVEVPFTPEECTRDLILERALAL